MMQTMAIRHIFIIFIPISHPQTPLYSFKTVFHIFLLPEFLSILILGINLTIVEITSEFPEINYKYKAVSRTKQRLTRPEILKKHVLLFHYVLKPVLKLSLKFPLLQF